jgi:HD-GYP domain-containing protein (c-di-GMP phosphodiesterase class II)
MESERFIMKILLIEDAHKPLSELQKILRKNPDAEVQVLGSLQEGIQRLEASGARFDLVVCDYHGQGTVLLKCLFDLCPNTPCIFISDGNQQLVDPNHTEYQLRIEALNRKNLASEIERSFVLFQRRGFFKDCKTADLDYVRTPAKTFLDSSEPLTFDVYIRQSANRYYKIFNKDERLEANDINRYIEGKGIEYFYVRRDEATAVVTKQDEALDRLVESDNVDPAVATAAVESALGLVHDLLEQTGFTPEVQALAKKSVTLTLKVLGTKPTLAEILERLQEGHGMYITSHSVMLAEVCCAITTQVGWKSAPSLFKLTLASFLHDLGMQDNHMAKMRTLHEAKSNSRLSPQDVMAFRLHPFKAAEYARKFHEIPPDVDTILFQHHEQPDGSGFPRGLFFNQLIPLSCIFIIAHDMLHFFLEMPKSHATIEQFVLTNGSRYQTGVFRKIIKSLATGIEIAS